MTKALFVVSAADHWTLNDGTKHPSGFWGEELAMPHKIFTEAGWEITVATPAGKAPTLDRLSMSRTAGMPSKLREVVRYLAYDPVSGALLTQVPRSGKTPALLCHAPAATLAAENEDGSWPFAGYRMTGLSNTEEKFNSFGRKAPWLLVDRLRERGAQYVKARLLLPFVVVDRNLYTGQNPTSSERLAKRLVADLDR